MTSVLLGCGVDVVCPMSNCDLYAASLDSGRAVSSAYLPGMPLEAWRFPTGDRPHHPITAHPAGYALPSSMNRHGSEDRRAVPESSHELSERVDDVVVCSEASARVGRRSWNQRMKAARR